MRERQVGDQERKTEDVSKDMIKLYGILLGQCSPTMRAHLEADPNWENIDLTKDPVELLKTIQSALLLLPAMFECVWRPTYVRLPPRSSIRDDNTIRAL